MKLNTILRRIIVAGMFIVPFIPLLVANGGLVPNLFFPFITGKNFLFRIIVEIMFGAWVILASTDPAYRPRRSWLLYSLLAFVGIIAIADMIGVNPYKSFWSNYERMEGLVTLLHLLAYFLVSSTVLATKRSWNWFWNVSIWASLLVTFYGFLQLTGRAVINQGGVRLDATLGNATYLAIYLVIHIFITAYIMLSPDMFLVAPAKFFNKNTPIDPHKIITGSVIILLELIILYNTATRGALLGIIAGAFIAAVLIALFERQRKTVRRAAFIVSAAAVLVVAVFFVVKDTQFVANSPVLRRFASISTQEATTKSRFMIWNMAYQGFKERPLLGWGQENFNYVFNKYYDPRMYNQEQWFDRTHNVILDWVIAGGLLGVLAYLAFFGCILYCIWKKGNDDYEFTLVQKSILTGLLVAHFVHNLFVFDNLVSYILFFSVASFVYSRRVLRPTQAQHTYQENFVVAPVTLIATLVVMYVLNVPALSANMTLIDAITPQYKTEERVNFFKQALARNSFGNQEIREQLMTFASQVAGDQQVSAQTKGAVFELAKTEADRQIAVAPRDARMYVIAGSMLQSTGQLPASVEYLQKALELSPRKQNVYIGLGASHLYLKEYQKGLEAFKKAYELEPNYENARLLYGMAAIYAKDYALADRILASTSPETVTNSEEIMQAYYIAGNYKKVLELWKRRTAQNPASAQAHVSLAAAYLLVKDNAGAIAEIRKAIELEPAFKIQGEEYIKQIRAGKIPQ